MQHHHLNTTSAADRKVVCNSASAIERIAGEVALSFGVSAARDFAAAFLDRMQQELGGQQVYLPKRRLAEDRHREIRSRFKGNNVAELAREYGLTPRSVRRITGPQPAASVAESAGAEA